MSGRKAWTLYFIRPIGMDGPTKIGISTDMHGRLADLARWSPFPLEVVASVPGGHALERNIHDCFADLHLHCEWFKPHARITEAVEKIAAGVPVHEAIDLSKRVGDLKAAAKARYSASRRAATLAKRAEAA